MNIQAVFDASRLPPYAHQHRATIWWGIVGLMAIEATVFACLIGSFFYLQSGQPAWPPSGTRPPELVLPTVSTLVLLASIVPVYWADRAIKEGRTFPLKVAGPVSILLATIFLAIKAYEYSHIGFRWDSHAYGSVVWTMVGFHSAHVLVVILKTMVVSVLAWREYFTAENRIGVTVNGLYWYFVAAVWVPLYFTIYWASRL